MTGDFLFVEMLVENKKIFFVTDSQPAAALRIKSIEFEC